MTAQPASASPSASTAHRRSLAEAGIALGPLDGRYRAAVEPLVDHLSEAALNRIVRAPEPLDVAEGRARLEAALSGRFDAAKGPDVGEAQG